MTTYHVLPRPTTSHRELQRATTSHHELPRATTSQNINYHESPRPKKFSTRIATSQILRKTTNHQPKIDICRPGLFFYWLCAWDMYQQIFLAKFPENMILPGENEALQITASILMAFCKGNLSVDDLVKLKSILSRFSNDKATLNLRIFSIFLSERCHYDYRSLTSYHFLTDF